MGGVLDVVYPRSCAGCGQGAWPFCAACVEFLPYLGEGGCLRCGARTTAGRDRCRSCPPSAITWARAPFLFDGPVRAAIHRLKFSGDRCIADALGAAMLQSIADQGVRPDAVTWAPLGRRRRATRGYDQARALAVVVARELDVPLQRFLRRRWVSGSQARRSGVERRGAMVHAFTAVRPSPPVVLVVDDVLTTGSTAGACAAELRSAGARSVGVLTAARSLR